MDKMYIVKKVYDAYLKKIPRHADVSKEKDDFLFSEASKLFFEKEPVVYGYTLNECTFDKYPELKQIRIIYNPYVLLIKNMMYAEYNIDDQGLLIFVDDRYVTTTEETRMFILAYIIGMIKTKESFNDSANKECSNLNQEIIADAFAIKEVGNKHIAINALNEFIKVSKGKIRRNFKIRLDRVINS